MKKAFVLIITLLVVLSGCSSMATTSITATTTTFQYLPSKDSVAYKTGVDVLEITDKFLNISADLQNKLTTNTSSEKMDALKNTGLKLLNLYVKTLKDQSSLLKAQSIIDNHNSDIRVGPYTDLIQANTALLANISERDTLHIEIGIQTNDELLKYRNELSECLGKENRAK